MPPTFLRGGVCLLLGEYYVLQYTGTVLLVQSSSSFTLSWTPHTIMASSLAPPSPPGPPASCFSPCRHRDCLYFLDHLLCSDLASFSECNCSTCCHDSFPPPAPMWPSPTTSEENFERQYAVYAAFGVIFGCVLACCACAAWALSDKDRCQHPLLGGRVWTQRLLPLRIERPSAIAGKEVMMSVRHTIGGVSPMAEYEQVKLLGRGASGSAYLMRRPGDGDLVVCKVVSLPTLRTITESERPDYRSGARSVAPSGAVELLGSVRRAGERAKSVVVHGLGSLLLPEKSARLSSKSFSKSVRFGRHRSTVGSGRIGSKSAAYPVAEDVPSEVEILRALDHAHIVKYLHSDQEVDGMVRIWMEYAPGGSLERAIRKHAKFNLGFTTLRVCTWIIQLADALAHMHAKRVLHRDLKSANVFLTYSGDVKLGDFGVARSFSTQTQFATSQVGTPYYMAPEVINNEPYGAESDVWSLGVILYEIITLTRPFDADNLGALVINITNGR